MAWHITPKDDAWRQVTLASVEQLEQRLWLRCNGCGHSAIIAPRAFAERAGVDMTTPLLTIGQALRCVECGEQKGHCWPEPHGV